MTAPRRGVALTPMETRRDVIVSTAALADELGYEVFSLAEGWGFDSTLVLAEAAQRTRRIVLCSGVLSVWGRTPATLAMTAATLHQLSAGRYVLGLGPSTRALVEGFHDLPFAHPAARLREVTAKVRALLAGEPARLDGTRGARPIRLGQPPVPDLPIWVAAMGDRTLRVAAELGDGWFPVLVTRDRLAGRAPELDRLRRAAGQRTGPLTVAAGPLTVVDADAGTARGVAASYVAWYLGAMGDVYARSVSEQGYGAEVEAVRAADPRPARSGAWSRPRPRSCWRRSPPTGPPRRSANAWSRGTRRSNRRYRLARDPAFDHALAPLTCSFAAARSLLSRLRARIGTTNPEMGVVGLRRQEPLTSCMPLTSQPLSAQLVPTRCCRECWGQVAALELERAYAAGA